MSEPSAAAAAAAAAVDASVHKVKTISFKGRRVPIMLQDLNGPCPLLAIANVLLLRNQIQLPAGLGEVSQTRLVAMVADWLLDANSLEGERGAALSEEQRASLAHNLSDAISLLPKLTTGIDVNVRFHDTAGFEYTPETAVFDLLDIPLVHGWLVDPQDAPTAAAVGRKSYNELVVQLVTTLGSAATPRQLTPTASLRAGQASGDGPSPRAVAAAAAAAGAQQQQAVGQAAQAQPGQQQGQLSAEQLSAALRDTLRVSLPAQRDMEGASSGPASARSGAGGAGSMLSMPDSSRASMQTSASMQSMVNRMLTDLVTDAFTSQAVTPSYTSRSTGVLPDASASDVLRSSSPAEEGEEATSALRPDGSAGGAAAEPGAPGELPPPRVQLALTLDEAPGAQRPVSVQLAVQPAQLPPSPFDSPAASQGGLRLEARHLPATPHPSAASMQADEAAASGAAAAAAAGGPPSGGGSGGASPGEAALREALLVQQFLDGHPSQLTYHGLLALQEGLRPNQLAVFFRNNHFSTLFKHEGQLYILVTDEGFLYEPDVVWEHLMDVSNDTQLVDGEFRPFVPHASHEQARERQAAAHDAEWAAAAAAAAAGEHTHDSDLALAMQLQAEEEERARQEHERRQAAAARQQEEARRQAPQALVQQQRLLPSQRRPASPGGGKKKKDKSDSSCSIM